jgi:hypothetical protein
MSAFFRGGSIVDPIPGHRHDVAFLLEGGDHPELMGRRHPGVDIDPLHLALELLIAHAIQLCPGDDPTIPEEAELPRDGLGRQRMIPW